MNRRKLKRSLLRDLNQFQEEFLFTQLFLRKKRNQMKMTLLKEEDPHLFLNLKVVFQNGNESL
jgi:hypothetical protein